MVRTQVVGLGHADQRLGGEEGREERVEHVSGSDRDAGVPGGVIDFETEQREGEEMGCSRLPERERQAASAQESGDKTYWKKLLGTLRSCRQP